LGEKVAGAGPFKVGSTVKDVLAVMGTPDSYSASSMSYGHSLVFFSDGVVTSYSDINNNLKIQ
ncbi:hypothetical protein QFZ77_007648, partial [Paenibacillus sp. V4I3]|uniref:hypothetical protein n=1 Tax=Paenibacillus sp. V4I3 TaxID=3042305 RepID=UPI00277D8369